MNPFPPDNGALSERGPVSRGKPPREKFINELLQGRQGEDVGAAHRHRILVTSFVVVLIPRFCRADLG